jgi:hypothetical protein
VEYKVIAHTMTGTTERTYRGFQPMAANRTTLKPGTLMVVAWFDGQPDTWLVDGEDGIKELRRYYVADWGPDRDIPFDVWEMKSKGAPYVGDIRRVK